MKIIVIYLLVFLIGFALFNNDREYFQETDRACLVLDKLESTNIGKYRATNEFILVVKLPDNRITDITVRPYIWSQSKEGDIVHLELSEFELYRDGWKSFIRFVGAIIMLIVTVIGLVDLVILVYDKFIQGKS